MIDLSDLRTGYLIVLSVTCFACAPMTAQRAPQCSGPRYEAIGEKAGTAFERGRLKKVYKMMLLCAEAGDPSSQFSLGILLDSDEEGQILNVSDTQREQEALKWIKKAASSGLEEAIIEIANSYANGWLGLPENDKLERCWRTAIEDKEQITRCLELEKEIL